MAVLVLVIAVLGWKYYQLKKDPNSNSKATIARIVKQVGKIYELPTDEEPTVAKIQDKHQLAKQEFYSKAENGDYVLIYSKNKVALIYRESNSKLVNVGPVNFVGNNQQQAAVAKPEVSVLNGSGSSEKLNAATDKLNELGNQIALSGATVDAKNKNTAKTIVADVSGQHSSVASIIADTLGADMQASLPNGESAPAGASIVVIVGKN